MRKETCDLPYFCLESDNGIYYVPLQVNFFHITRPGIEAATTAHEEDALHIALHWHILQIVVLQKIARTNLKI